jgi:hypothetical protein
LRHGAARLERSQLPGFFAAMLEAAEKLRFLARQARLLARSQAGLDRANALHSLAKLYEQEALALEQRELSAGHQRAGALKGCIAAAEQPLG